MKCREMEVKKGSNEVRNKRRGREKHGKEKVLIEDE